jgi:hypothetical protein
MRDMQMRSNPSLGQLAQDFAAQANVTGSSSQAYGSSSSLGRYAPSSTSLSGPTTPYGHPLGHALSGGVGVGRHSGMLPSIADWEHTGTDVQMDGNGNPTYQVVSMRSQRHDSKLSRDSKSRALLLHSHSKREPSTPNPLPSLPSQRSRPWQGRNPKLDSNNIPAKSRPDSSLRFMPHLLCWSSST